MVVDNVAFKARSGHAVDALGGRVGHYVLTSSSAVYTDRYIRRPSARRRRSRRARGHRCAEPVSFPPGARLRQWQARSRTGLRHGVGAPWTFVRPPVILAADDRTRRVWWFVQRLLDGGPLLVPDWGPGRIFQLAWTHDVARAIAGVAAIRRLSGGHTTLPRLSCTPRSRGSRRARRCWASPLATFTWRKIVRQGICCPVAGRPFGHALFDCSAIRCELGFEPAPESIWLADTLRGCVANPPVEASAGYDRRGDELDRARAILDRQHSEVKQRA